MRRKKSYHNDKQNRSCHYLYSVALLLTVSGLWLICYHSYHYTRSLTAIRSYTEAPDQAMEQDSLKGGILSDRSLSSTPSTLKQALSMREAQLLYLKRPERGDHFGTLAIPKLKLTVPIYEGTGTDELDLGVGHYVGSVLPGEQDNCVLSGHRNTVFQELGKVGVGDSLLITTDAGSFTYIVDKVRIVEKDDRTVIVPKPHATLTISTCYPFVYTGAAPERYVLVAHLSSS